MRRESCVAYGVWQSNALPALTGFLHIACLYLRITYIPCSVSTEGDRSVEVFLIHKVEQWSLSTSTISCSNLTWYNHLMELDILLWCRCHIVIISGVDDVTNVGTCLSINKEVLRHILVTDAEAPIGSLANSVRRCVLSRCVEYVLQFCRIAFHTWHTLIIRVCGNLTITIAAEVNCCQTWVMYHGWNVVKGIVIEALIKLRTIEATCTPYTVCCHHIHCACDSAWQLLCCDIQSLTEYQVVIPQCINIHLTSSLLSVRLVEQWPVNDALNRLSRVRIFCQLTLWTCCLIVNLKIIFLIIDTAEFIYLGIVSVLRNNCTWLIDAVVCHVTGITPTVCRDILVTCSQIYHTGLASCTWVITSCILVVTICIVLLDTIIIWIFTLSKAVALFEVILVKVVSHLTIVEVLYSCYSEVITVVKTCVLCRCSIWQYLNSQLVIHTIYKTVMYVGCIVTCHWHCYRSALDTEVIYSARYCVKECRSLSQTVTVSHIYSVAHTVEVTLEVLLWSMIELFVEYDVVQQVELCILTTGRYIYQCVTYLGLCDVVVLIVTADTINELIERLHILLILYVDTWLTQRCYILWLWVIIQPSGLSGLVI